MWGCPAERLPAAPVSPRPAPAPPSPAPPASCAGDADPNPVPSGFEPLTQNAYHQLEQVGNYLLNTLAQGPDAAPPSRAAVTPLPAASSTSTAAAAHLPTCFVGGDQGSISPRVDDLLCDLGGLGHGPHPKHGLSTPSVCSAPTSPHGPSTTRSRRRAPMSRSCPCPKRSLWSLWTLRGPQTWERKNPRI